MNQKITPTIRCTHNNAQEIAEHYCDIFPDAKITKSNSVVVSFELFGQSLATLNGGGHDQGKANGCVSFSLWINDKDLTKLLRDKLIQ